MATKDHVRGGQDADGTRSREPSVSVRLPGGTVSDRILTIMSNHTLLNCAVLTSQQCDLAGLPDDHEHSRSG
jgi:hypothetical protein